MPYTSHAPLLWVAALAALASTLSPQRSVAQDFGAERGDRASGWAGQTRSEVLGRNGMVATSQPLAAQAGLEILKQGGNAVDAAVAAAAVLNVVEPQSAGVGGDVFVLLWSASEKKLLALNGSGRAPQGATPEHLALRGFTDHMPEHGIDSATVPGAVDAWDALLKRVGTLSFAQVLRPAEDIAEQGFAVSERIASDWASATGILRPDPDSVATYLPGGKPPAAYQVFRNPDLARTFRVLQAQGRDGFYSGEIAAAILAKTAALGGTLSGEDLLATHADWVEPIHSAYHGYEVYELPPNTQGFAVLEMLNIIEVCGLKLRLDLKALGPHSARYWQLLIEAKKIAYADLYAKNGDPEFVDVPVDKLISKSYAAAQCGRIDMHRAGTPAATGDPVGGTVYIATADRWGNMVSFIYSIYDSFGSGVTIPGYGFVLNDRGALFSLKASSPNLIAPGKRPFHTLIPGFLMKDGAPLTVFGLMGGDQQAQGHVQVLVDMIDLGANPQAASDAARFTHSQATNTLSLESNLFRTVGKSLTRMGHHVLSANGDGMGGFQAISVIAGSGSGTFAGVYRGASDHRKDGAAVGW